MVAAAALKHPNPQYRRKIGAATRFDLNEIDYPLELGWIYTAPPERRRGLSKALCSALIASVAGKGMFATCRVDNEAIQGALSALHFSAIGEPFKSSRGPYEIQALARAPT